MAQHHASLGTTSAFNKLETFLIWKPAVPLGPGYPLFKISSSIVIPTTASYSIGVISDVNRITAS
jgi:hypothetical protein